MIKRFFYLITFYLIVVLQSIEIASESTNGKWPAGTYGLPEPTTGCPSGWSTGSVYHNTEDDQNINRRSNASYHMSGVFNSRGIEQTFCMKKEDNNAASSSDNLKQWPQGEYCIYKKGECPVNFEVGSIFWDDEKSQQDLPNSHEGSIPDGEYTLNTTLIYFCCTNTGSVDTPIELPTDTPFYLFPYKNRTCQSIKGMRSNVEFVFFDDNDEGNRDRISGAVPYGPNPDRDYNILLYSCYYEATGSDSNATAENNSPTIQKEILKDTKTALSISQNPRTILLGITSLLMIAVIVSTVVLLYRKYHKNIADQFTSAMQKIKSMGSKPSNSPQNDEQDTQNENSLGVV